MNQIVQTTTIIVMTVARIVIIVRPRTIARRIEEITRSLASVSIASMIAPTVGAIMLAMLTLAKDRVISSMRRTIVRGRTMITILATLITMIVAVWTVWFILQFSRRLTSPETPSASAPASRTGPLSR